MGIPHIRARHLVATALFISNASTADTFGVEVSLFLYPAMGQPVQLYNFNDTINVTYTSTFLTPVLITYCNAGKTEVSEHPVPPLNGTFPFLLNFTSPTPCWFDLANSSAAGRAFISSEDFILSPEKRLGGSRTFGPNGVSELSSPIITTSKSKSKLLDYITAANTQPAATSEIGSSTTTTLSSGSGAPAGPAEPKDTSTTTTKSATGADPSDEVAPDSGGDRAVEQGLSVAARVGIGLGVAVAVLMLGTVTYLRWWRRREVIYIGKGRDDDTGVGQMTSAVGGKGMVRGDEGADPSRGQEGGDVVAGGVAALGAVGGDCGARQGGEGAESGRMSTLDSRGVDHSDRQGGQDMAPEGMPGCLRSGGRVAGSPEPKVLLAGGESGAGYWNSMISGLYY